jgi:lipopolysaccharide/colanic/teichoic acid biosynthesis glycosyltransferase
MKGNATIDSIARPVVTSAHRITDYRVIQYVNRRDVMERFTAVLLLVLLSPIVLTAILAVRLSSPRPAIYRQTQVGLDGEPFSILKIRTIGLNAESASGPVWSQPGDPRVTNIGRFLRWSHIDELPQLANVWRGEMSLIGPRPERPEFVDQLANQIPNYKARLCVRPGITGLAQVTYRGDDSIDSVRLKTLEDERYIRQMSLTLDIEIALYTLAGLVGIRRTPDIVIVPAQII